LIKAKIIGLMKTMLKYLSVSFLVLEVLASCSKNNTTGEGFKNEIVQISLFRVLTNGHTIVDSVIDNFSLNQLVDNVDAYYISTYLPQDKNEKLKMGPIWDFNMAFGNADYCGGGTTKVWAYKYNGRHVGNIWLISFGLDRLLQAPAFVTQLQV
tara:strand:- start:15703 stop:16164 length:462 start_codon:yes stop_codon:yes gene_type:complete